MKSDFKSLANRSLKDSANLKLAMAENTENIVKLAQALVDTIKDGKKLLVAGNGGSASDAQHMAAELVGRYLKERDALPAIALTTDTSAITAISNDFGYKKVFSRQVEALGVEGDLFLGISTSGNSENIMEALKVARKKGLTTASLSGKGGGLLPELSDISIVVPSDETPRIQEAHITIIHVLCEAVEEGL